jgi:hypothetical protein
MPHNNPEGSLSLVPDLLVQADELEIFRVMLRCVSLYATVEGICEFLGAGEAICSDSCMSFMRETMLHNKGMVLIH